VYLFYVSFAGLGIGLGLETADLGLGLGLGIIDLDLGLVLLQLVLTTTLELKSSNIYFDKYDRNSRGNYFSRESDNWTIYLFLIYVNFE